MASLRHCSPFALPIANICGSGGESLRAATPSHRTARKIRAVLIIIYVPFSSGYNVSGRSTASAGYLQPSGAPLFTCYSAPLVNRFSGARNHPTSRYENFRSVLRCTRNNTLPTLEIIEGQKFSE